MWKYDDTDSNAMILCGPMRVVWKRIEFRFVWLNLNLFLVFTVILLNPYNYIADGRQLNVKKKVVIIGEMSDMNDDLMANETSRSDPEFYDDFNDQDLGHYRIRRGQSHRFSSSPALQGFPPGMTVRRKSSGSLFVPVAAYSVTKTNPTTSASSNSYRKRQGNSPNKHTESAVYGYMQRPEIIEFRGQYFYGPRPGDTIRASGSHPEASHSWDSGIPAASQSYPSYSGGNKIKGGGLGPGGLLLATLPLILAPMLSYLFTPMIIPITATVAAGRKKRNAAENINSPTVITNNNVNIEPPTKSINDTSGIYGNRSIVTNTNSWARYDRFDDPKFKEAQVVAEYLRKVNFDEKITTQAIANYLQCDGMLGDNDHCIERLSCEFSDPANYDAPELDRAVTSILLGHILSNEYITESFKKKLKYAAVYGKDHSGGCHKYTCVKVVS